MQAFDRESSQCLSTLPQSLACDKVGPVERLLNSRFTEHLPATRIAGADAAALFVLPYGPVCWKGRHSTECDSEIGNEMCV